MKLQEVILTEWNRLAALKKKHKEEQETLIQKSERRKKECLAPFSQSILVERSNLAT
ncbi:hypothetical protein LCGC14_1370930 [marine sediment metagenome]|uniref:Uncharacterized protein n=1 Tax=marine sediment metagenome TaxID=412755 RepID=A0A0F9K5T4_9ZZZZ